MAEDFWVAAKLGNVEEVKGILLSNPTLDINSKDEGGWLVGPLKRVSVWP